MGGINSKCLKNPKNSGIKKVAEGKSEDYVDLEIIKTADVSTKKGLNEKNKSIMNLFNRYDRVFEGSKKRLQEMCEGHPTVLANDVLANYKYDAYDHFIMAINSMDLSRIQHMKGSWSFYIQLVRYLAAYNRKVINNYCGGLSKDKSLKVYASESDFINKKKPLSSDVIIQKGYVLVNDKNEVFRCGASLNEMYVRDDHSNKIVKVVDLNDKTLFENKSPKKWNGFNAYNVRSEWTNNTDGEEISVFDTSNVGSTTVEAEYERKEESKVLGEAISNAYSKFNGLQQKIWNSRLDQVACQQSVKLEKNNTPDRMGYSSPKYEDLGKRCGVSSLEVKENLRYMKLVVEQEICAANRKYHTDYKM